MRALQITEYGDNSVLHIADVPDLAPTGSQVLVTVEAAALNPLDATLRAGYAQTIMPLRFPATLGGDVAGVVSAIGPETPGSASASGSTATPTPCSATAARSPSRRSSGPAFSPAFPVT